MRISILIIPFIITHFSLEIKCQDKRGNQWIIGGNGTGEGIVLDFNSSPVDIYLKQTGIKMEGSNTSISDKNGNLLFYSNGCKIVNFTGEVMDNGDTINPGIIQNSYCSSASGSPLRQGVIAIPAPGLDSIYYVFNLDLDQPYLSDPNFNSLAPMRLYYQKIDMSINSGLGAVLLKNQIALLDTFSRGNIQACRHLNGQDWWIIIPKSHTNCYYLIPVTANGVQPAQLKCSGKIWTDEDSGAQVTFSPDGEKYIRFNAWNGLNIYNFDNATGELYNPVHIDFSGDTINYIAGVAVSSNSRFLYVCARKKIYQFDLQATDISASKLLLGVWDGHQNPFPTIFYLAALAPDGKIYISSTSSTYNLHEVKKPDCQGVSSELIQHGIELPDYNFASIPNLPHYNNLPVLINCDSTLSAIEKAIPLPVLFIAPNPASDEIVISHSTTNQGHWLLSDISGAKIKVGQWDGNTLHLDVLNLDNGVYVFKLYTKEGQLFVGKLIVQK
ncbi:MAG: T9SS type A sorting domain-containing protein [Chitinophagales bacterium]|nr:T9SS type A sorting domain-containing protein [Chitinophagales bacterium]